MVKPTELATVGTFVKHMGLYTIGFLLLDTGASHVSTRAQLVFGPRVGLMLLKPEPLRQDHQHDEEQHPSPDAHSTWNADHACCIAKANT